MIENMYNASKINGVSIIRMRSIVKIIRQVKTKTQRAIDIFAHVCKNST
jgi:hypothetical protein